MIDDTPKHALYPLKRRSRAKPSHPVSPRPVLSEGDQQALVTPIMGQAIEVGRCLECLIRSLGNVDDLGVRIYADAVERHATALETCARLSDKRGVHLRFLCLPYDAPREPPPPSAAGARPLG